MYLQSYYLDGDKLILSFLYYMLCSFWFHFSIAWKMAAEQAAFNLIENATDIISLLNSDLAIETRACEEEVQHDLLSSSFTTKSDTPKLEAHKSKAAQLKGVAQTIYVALDVVPTAIDSLVNRTGLSVAEIAQQLILMELKGQVEQVPGGYVRL